MENIRLLRGFAKPRGASRDRGALEGGARGMENIRVASLSPWLRFGWRRYTEGSLRWRISARHCGGALCSIALLWSRVPIKEPQGLHKALLSRAPEALSLTPCVGVPAQ